VTGNKTADQQQNSMYPVIAGAAGGGLLLLIASLVACMCLKRRENSQPEGKLYIVPDGNHYINVIPLHR